MSVRPFTTSPRHLKFHDSVELYVTLPDLIQVADVLRVGCELINNKNSAVTNLGICAVNVNYS